MNVKVKIIQYPHGYNSGWEFEDVCPSITISSWQNNNFIKYEIMGEFITIVGNKQRNPHRGSIDGVSPTITAACGSGGGMTPMLTDATIEETKTFNFMEQERKHNLNLPPELEGKRFRIRKLTERECLRLMDVDDEDIDKILGSGISRSSAYKLAGNSIVVSVLFHIFRKMFIEPEPDVDKNSNGTQLSLF